MLGIQSPILCFFYSIISGLIYPRRIEIVNTLHIVSLSLQSADEVSTHKNYKISKYSRRSVQVVHSHSCGHVGYFNLSLVTAPLLCSVSSHGSKEMIGNLIIFSDLSTGWVCSYRTVSFLLHVSIWIALIYGDCAWSTT